MDIKTRVRNILVSPDTEWPVIAAETTPAKDLVTGYVLPLAAIGAVAGFIGRSIIGYSLPFVGTYRQPILSGLVAAIFVIVMAIAGVFILAYIINALAPTFNGEKNQAQALKLAAYSYTPAWIAAVFQILPPLAILAVLGALYGFYLLYRGLPVLMKSPPDKAVAYTAVVLVAAIVLWFVIAAIGGVLMAGSAGMAGMGMGADTGGIGGLTSLASWASAEGQKETEDMSERTERVDGRLVHTRVSKTGGENEFSIVIADRFMVTASGAVDIGMLKAAVSGLDLQKLESLKAQS